MKILITGKKIELTDGIKGAVEDILGKLEKYLHEDTEVKVTVSARKAKQKIEVTIIPINGPIIRAEDSEENLYAAIDVVYDNKTLSSSAGAIWKNIKNDDWAQEALLAVEVESYLKKKSCKNRLQEAADAYF